MAAHRLKSKGQMNVLRCMGLGVLLSLFSSFSVDAKTHAASGAAASPLPAHSQDKPVAGIQTHHHGQGLHSEKAATITPRLGTTQSIAAVQAIQTDVKAKNNSIKKTPELALQPAPKRKLNSALSVAQPVQAVNTDMVRWSKPFHTDAPDIKQVVPAALVGTPIVPGAPLVVSPSGQDVINTINQRFSAVPIKYCPRTSNGYGFEMRYASANMGSASHVDNEAMTGAGSIASIASAPLVTKVYGRAYAAGLQENDHVLSMNGQAIRSQREFNALIYGGQTASAEHLIPSIQLTVLQNGVQRDIPLTKGDYCLSNLAIESEHNVLRVNQETKGSGYAMTAETTAFVDAGFLSKLSPEDRLTLAAVAAAEQYRHGLKVKRGKAGMIFGQIFGSIVMFTTGIPITEVTTSSSTAIGMKEDGEGALRPAASYGYYLGLAPNDMRASLEKLAAFKESYRAQGKRYDWFVRSDLREFDAAVQEIKVLSAKGSKNIMLKPQLFANKKEAQKEGREQAKQPVVEMENGVGSY